MLSWTFPLPLKVKIQVEKTYSDDMIGGLVLLSSAFILFVVSFVTQLFCYLQRSLPFKRLKIIQFLFGLATKYRNLY